MLTVIISGPTAYVSDGNGNQAMVEGYGTRVKWSQLQQDNDAILQSAQAAYAEEKAKTASKKTATVNNRKAQERAYDAIYNDGGEGYNPYRYAAGA